MKDEKYKADIQYLKRVVMSLTDIRYCIKYLESISTVDDELIYRAVSEAIIISYARPFSGYSKYHVVKGLKQEFKTTFSEIERRVHERILSDRNMIIGHSDSKAYGVNINIFEFFKDSKFLIPMQRRIPEIISKEDILILKSCCAKIETYLFNEQERIKDILPMGSYQ